MKIIFLDIDGVLNSQESCLYYYEKYNRGGYGGFFRESRDNPTLENVLWWQLLVDNLYSIIKATEAKIVLSSTWRKFYSIECFKAMFALYGFNNIEIIGKTDNTGPMRGDEINQWLLDHDGQVDSYVILDDDSDMLPDQMDNFVQTDGLKGLSEDDAKKAIKILNR